MANLKVPCKLWSAGSAWRINTTQCPLERCHLQQLDGAGRRPPGLQRRVPDGGERNMLPTQPEANGTILEFLLIREENIF